MPPATGGKLWQILHLGNQRLKRNIAPRCSVWEGFFSDAYGTGEASYLTVKGLQDAGTIAMAKHYIGYEQETFRYDFTTAAFPRMSTEVEHRNPYDQIELSSLSPGSVQLPISSNIDDKATHEVGLGTLLREHLRLTMLSALSMGFCRSRSRRHRIRHVVST